MKEITQFKSNDGSTWATVSEALKRDNLLSAVNLVMQPLGDVPEEVVKGNGWLQHNPDTVTKAKQGILDLCKPDFAETWPVFNQPAQKVHPLSIVGRILDDAGGDPRSTAWGRFCRIDSEGREHQQCYYAYTAGPDKDHVCIEDRR